MTTVVKFIT